MDWYFCLIHFSIVVHSNITMQPKAKELKVEQWTKWRERARKKRSNFFPFVVNQLIFFLLLLGVSQHTYELLNPCCIVMFPHSRTIPLTISFLLSTLNSPSSTRYIIIIVYIGMDYFSFSSIFFMSFSCSCRCCYFYKQKRKYNQKKKWSKRILSFRSFEDIGKRSEKEKKKNRTKNLSCCCCFFLLSTDIVRIEKKIKCLNWIQKSINFPLFLG